jgi:glutamyl-tRNA(Gln) amidotransferase subunit D
VVQLTTENSGGYGDPILSFLSKAGAKVGDDVILEMKDGNTIEGVLLPQTTYERPTIVTLKLPNGYNVGLSINRISSITLKQKGREPSFIHPSKPASASGLPNVTIIGTGGTIASRIDYRTGGVKPALTAEELYLLVPELSGLADITTKAVFNVYSENLTPRHWSKLAEEVASAVMEGAHGVVVAHGTDTMHYTAAALTFALENLPVPVVLVGSQRSSDRPSSDSAINMIGAVRFAAHAQVSGVFVVMHAGLSDTSLTVHLGVRVRKLHTSRRDAFQTVNGTPAGTIKGEEISLRPGFAPRRNSFDGFTLHSSFDEKVSLVKVYPGISPSIIEGLLDSGCRGIVFEGTGLGHAPRHLFDSIKAAVSRGVVVAMTSQCINGSVRMTVYDTGRDLLKLGVVPLGDMLSEVAYAKLSWLLGHHNDPAEIARLMRSNLRGELADRRLI